MPPSTVRLHHMHNRVEHQPPRVVIRMPNPSLWWQQRLKPVPHHLYHTGGLVGFGLRGLLGQLPRPASSARSVMIIPRPGLMPASPARPAQKCRCAALDGQDQVPEQMPYFGTTQPDTRLRLALKRAKLLVRG